ncbi:MAG: phage tail sheath family protein [Gammaproteobacteria bacterium]|nr:phage tail sheath family protein [Gammaproteobacteria bacterium]
MATYQTPGVYVEEISTLPPSVAEVSTAIPAFIGYTEKGHEVTRISSLIEFQEKFGAAKATKFTIKAKVIDSLAFTSAEADHPEFLMYYALSHYFKNGGGSCYIISIGNYDATPAKADFEKGLKLLEKEDEPTLILFPDAIRLSATDNYVLCQQALAQCNKLKDRFAILDIHGGEIDEFRDKIGTANLKYGAAYHPHLKTSLNFIYEDTDVQIDPPEGETGGDAQTLATIKTTNTSLYNQVKIELTKQRVELPPSAAVAGIYARVDRVRGVWKAPANESIAAVTEPVEKITHETQEKLNVDATAGKSINVIRTFTGKGTLVWGARTLAGNDNEWRYVSVRRLFNMIEESTRKATDFAVFEPNDATTWLKVKGMIEAYLYGLWERGALAGPTPESAYHVTVGLGKTMTSQDVLEGRMIVEIGVAAVRPAEFIIIRFMHKLQEA